MTTLQFKHLLANCLPYGVVEYWRTRKKKEHALSSNLEREAFHQARYKKINSVLNTNQSSNAIINGEDYNALIEHLANLGLPLPHILEGSIPQNSLAFICHHLEPCLSRDAIPVGLHIGNFVGVSLAYLTAFLVRQNQSSLMVSVDPNLVHRDIYNPQKYVLDLLKACDLLKNSLIITGYSGTKSVSNDGVIYKQYDPEASFHYELACEETLQNLSKICSKQYDIVILDGNHQADYLVKEIQNIVPLMKSTGIVVFDDVDTAWIEIQKVFQQVDNFGLTALASNGRVGIAKLQL